MPDGVSPDFSQRVDHTKQITWLLELTSQIVDALNIMMKLRVMTVCAVPASTCDGRSVDGEQFGLTRVSHESHWKWDLLRPEVIS